MKDIFEAIRKNDKQAVSDFLEQGVNLSSIDPESKRNALDLAADLEFDDIAEFLLDYEEKITVKTGEVDVELSFVNQQLTESSVWLASKSQQRFYFLDQALEVPSTYYEHSILEFSGAFNPIIFEAALFQLMQRHESLRTKYILNEEGLIVQEVVREIDVPLIYLDCQDDKECKIENFATREDIFIKEKFDLNKAPLWRVKLLHTSVNTFVATFVFHHIIVDGFSLFSVFFKDLFGLYEEILNNTDPQIVQTRLPAFQFHQYSEREREWCVTEDYQTQCNYWSERLKGYESHIELPEDVNAVLTMAQIKGHSIDFLLPEGFHYKLAQFSKTVGVTPFTTYLAAYFLLLRNYTQQNDIVIGTPFFNRSLSEHDSAIGCFLNTLPLRFQIDGEHSFSTFLKTLNIQIRNDFLKGQVSYNDIINQSELKKTGYLQDVIQVFFVYQLGLDMGFLKKNSSLPFSAQLCNIGHDTPGTSKYPISIELIQHSEDIHLIINYRSDLYSPSFIERFFTHYCRIINTVIETPEISIRDISMLTPEESAQQLVSWNDTARPYPNTTIHALFEAQVKRTPHAIALVYEGQEMTYNELNIRANQVAHYLREQGIGSQPDMLVGLGVERSFEMIIGILGILKAGAAYVPFDLRHPDARLQYMMAETKVHVFLTQMHLSEKWKLLAAQGSEEKKLLTIVSLDCMDWGDINSGANLPSAAELCDVAYIIYTSGSTGQPKGVVGLHAGMINRLEWMWAMYPLQEDEIFCHKTSLNFVDAIAEFFFPLLKGTKLHIVSSSVSEDGMQLGVYLKAHSITRIVLVPSLLRAMLDIGENFSSIKVMVVSGEVLSIDLMEKVQKNAPHLTMINLYGSSEISADATYLEVFAPGKIRGLSIGKPIDNMQAYVLDRNLSLLPTGIQGELYIGGTGLARGYLNRPELTAERFIEHQFNKDSAPTRLYRTGDLVRYLPDGNIKYIGRTDNQIKIRGFRVELEEIEAQLLKELNVSNAVVIAREGQIGNKQLIAYIVSNEAIDTEALKIQLSAFLPEYMIPTYVMQLEKMPLNVNGKVDRKALPAVDASTLVGQSYTAPKTETEKKLAAIFAELLHLPVGRIGLNDNFFHLGGHSLLSMSLLNRIKREWQSELSLKALFNSPTIGGIVGLIEQTTSATLSTPVLTKQRRPEHIPLSFSQQRLWFLDALLSNKALYQVPRVIRLKGHYDIEALQSAYRAMIERHESLRTRFLSIDGTPYQVIDEAETIPGLHVVSQKDLPTDIQTYVEVLISIPFDLSTGPLIVGDLLLINKEEAVLRINMHHIITDGVSVQVYMKELAAFYAHYTEGSASPEPLSLQYVDHTLWQRSWMKEGALDAQVDYWKKQLSDIPDVIGLPTDYMRPKELTYAGDRFRIQLEEGLVEGLKELATAHQTTMYMVLLSAFQIVLHRYSGQKTIVVGSPIANRRDAGTEGMLGFFVNTLALKGDFSESLTVTQFLEQMKETTLSAYGHQDISFEQLVTHLNVPRQTNVNPVFQVMLAYQEYHEENTRFGTLEMVPLEEIGYPITKFDMTLGALYQSGHLSLGIEYSKDLFKRKTIECFVTHLTSILNGMVKKPTMAIDKLPMLSETEIYQQLVAWNQTEKAYPKTTIHQLFEAQAEKNPEAIALVFEDQQLTYSELNQRANQLARYIHKQFSASFEANTLIAICFDRSIDMVISILGVLKAGAAYVPIDPEYPPERIDFILNDTQTNIVLTQSHLQHLFKDSIAVDHKPYQAEVSASLAQSSGPHDLAYVIYTSGTTGLPKGVMVEHHEFLFYQFSFNDLIKNSFLLNTAFTLSYCFDASLPTLFGSLVSGGTVLITKNILDVSPKDYFFLLKKHSVNTIRLTPSMLNFLVDELCRYEHNLTIVLGGETYNLLTINKVLQHKNIFLFNQYGPTECAVGSSVARLTQQVDKQIIGKQYQGKCFYLLDNNLTVVPVGCLGELYIGGQGLARGYLNRPELTAERFIWHKFSEESAPVRLYKTGDVVRYLPDGSIEYIGRTDHQIKLRGYRIELGEIESQLLKQAEISHAAVLVREDQGNKQLVAYIVSSRTSQETTEDKQSFISNLRQTLVQFLPEYMIPSHFQLLDAMPLNVNGKIDRKALTALLLEFGIEESYVAPVTEIEKTLAGLWSEVLRVSENEIGRASHFFHLGGHSLLMMTLLAKIRQTWQIEVALKAIFDQATLAAMGQVIHASLGKTSSLPLLVKQTRPEYIPLSFSQQRLWFLDALFSNKALYQVPRVIRLKGHYDIEALQSAYRAMIERHESLRTRFLSIDGTPYQVIDEAGAIPGLHVVSQKDLPTDVRTYVENRILTPFDLSTGPLIMGDLILINEEEAVLSINMHHIITDGASMQVYMKELAAFYLNYTEGGPSLEPLSLQYVDYTLWQRSWLKEEILDAQVDYWKKQLSDIPDVMGLPTDYARPKELTYAGDGLHIQLEKGLVEGLKGLAAVHQTTMYMVLLSAFQIVLHRYSGQKTIVVGSPIANRQDAGTEEMLGFFVNTLALKADFSESLTVTQFLEQMKATTLSAYEHQDIPFEQLVTHLNVPRQRNVNPVFQVMLAYQEYHEDNTRFGTLETVTLEETGYPIAKFDMTLGALYQGGDLSLTVEYSQDLFKRETIECFITHFMNILNAMVTAPTRTIHTLPMLTEAEVHKQLVIWNQTERMYPQTTIHQLFEAQVEKNPEAIALVFEDQTITYQVLNARANQVAHYLQAKGIGAKPDMLVGLGTERSFEMIVGILAILKAGGAYVPMDPTHPDDRLRYMLEDTNVCYVLTQSHLVYRWESLSNQNTLFAAIALDRKEDYASLPSENLRSITQSEHLAYVIYTSGTTGRPKGVMISQASITNYLLSLSYLFPLSTQDSVLQRASVSFDFSLEDIFLPLLTGARGILCSSEEQKDIVAMIYLMKRYAITLFDFTPSLLNLFLMQEGIEEITSLKTVFVGGEALEVSLPNILHKKFPDIHLYNSYGPTEATVAVTYHPLESETDISIGRPMDNVIFYILNEQHELVPVGVSGELYIGGVGLARGYLNRPELTAERFIWHKFNEESAPVRLYKTGDLVRYLPDGNIEYIGRTDHQIKLRGYRIELGEIESQLLKQAEISHATVLVREDQGNKQLVAYIVSSKTSQQTTEDKQTFISNLRQALVQFLPEYMIPSHFQLLDAMPLNVNGKIDRKALTALSLEFGSEDSYVAPVTEIEKTLAQLWSEVLRIPENEIGRASHFFHLGGHSLLMMTLLAKIRQTWQVEVALKAIFDQATLAAMGQVIHASLGKTSSLPLLVKQTRPEYIPLSFSQQRLWFLEQLLPGKALYQVPLVLRLNEHCNISALSQAYQTMIVRQESLRTRFEFVDGIAWQVIDSPEVIPGLSVCENIFSNQEALRTYLEASLLKPFNLSEGPLLRGEVITVGSDKEYILLIVMHHIITDGWSMQCYMKELAHLYRHYNNQSVPMLEPLPVQYVDYTLWQQSWLRGEFLQRQLDYWTAQLHNIPKIIVLPTDYSRPKELTYAGGRLGFHLSAAELLELKAYAKINNATLFMVMLSVLQIVLYRYSQQNVVVVGSPIANRTVKELDPLIGFFVNTLALKADFSELLTVGQLLEQIKKTTLDAYTHQDVPFEQVVHRLNVPRQVNVNPVFQVMFTYQEQRKELVLGDMQITSFEENNYPIAKFDLTLNIEHEANGFRCSFEYAKDLFSHATIEQLAKHFKQIARHIKPMAEKYVHELPLLTTVDIEQQLVTWNQTECPYPQTTIHQIFEEQVEKAPNAIALLCENQHLTYQELNERANQVAHYLRSEGIGSRPDMLVGIAIERSLEMLIGILAILKAGGAYVPFSTTFPDARLLNMVNDTEIQVLLTQTSFFSKWQFLAKEGAEAKSLSIVLLDNEAFFAEYSKDNLPEVSQINHLAYVMYTSGSTGQPKGVMIEHRGVVSLVKDVSYVHFSPSDRTLQLSDVAFDAATFEIWGVLLNGGRLYIVPDALDLMTDLFAFQRYLEINGISILWLTKSLFDHVYSQKPDVFQSLQYLLIGGEALNKQLVQQLISSPYKPTYLVNGYGPTENTTFSCTYTINTENNSFDSVPIGTPISNRTCYILDNKQQLLPVGVSGELYVGGAGLARGYFKREDLTAERFVNYHGSEESDPVRLYRTGDLARYLPNGNVEYVGRVDNQVKIRGFRVELEEIEGQLLQSPDIQIAAVVVRGDSANKQLVAYIVPKDKKSGLDASALKIKLSAFLPDYMIPAHIVSLEKMPLNVNGKVDREALPALNEVMLINEDDIAPQTEIEKALIAIWTKLLNVPVESIGLTNNFFDQGGNSLLAMQFVFQAKQQLHIETTIAQFYQNPTIEALIRASSNGLTSTFDASILPILVQRTKKPIFLIHPIGGLATPYRNLLPSLEGNYAIYGVNYPNLMEGEIVTYDSLETLATDYIQRIKTVSPEGPYCLGGWSLGGNIALEITRQLQANGETVELLLFLDTGYQPYKEQTERGYTEIFMNELLAALDPEFAVQSNIASRIVEISYHLYLLLHAYEAKQIEAVNKLFYVKCQGSLVTLASQHKENLDWSYSDVLNGLRYFLKSGQHIHIRDISCNHFELFDVAQKEILNELIISLLAENQEDAYEIGNDVQNILIATKKEGTYSLQRFRRETGTNDLIQPVENSYPQDLEAPSYRPILSRNDLALTRMVQYRQDYSLNVRKLLNQTHYDHHFTNNIIKLLGEVCPLYAVMYTMNLAQRLLVLRFISSESTELVAAYVLDDTILSMMLLIAQQLNAPLMNYLNVALGRNDSKRVGRAFDAGLWLGMSMAVPMLVYGSMASKIGDAISMEGGVIEEWRPLAHIHMLAILPTLANITMETFYQTIYQRQQPALGAVVEMIPVLLSVLLFKHLRHLNGMSLGLALSIGSICKWLFYIQDLIRSGQMEQHSLFKSVPLKLMKQYGKDIHKLVSSSLFTFSNFLILACLISSKNGAANLTGYAVARSGAEIINLTTNIVTASSTKLTSRFLMGHQFTNALATEVISMSVSLSLAAVLSTVLSAISDEQYTKLFINTEQIPGFVQEAFFSSVKESAYYFIGLELVNSIRTPVTSYLSQSFAYSDIQKITFLCYFVLANAAILATFFGSSNNTKGMVRVLLAANIATTLLMLYQWVKINDFQINHSVTRESDILVINNGDSEERLDDAGVHPGERVDSAPVGENRYVLLAAPTQSRSVEKTNLEIERPFPFGRPV